MNLIIVSSKYFCPRLYLPAKFRYSHSHSNNDKDSTRVPIANENPWTNITLSKQNFTSPRRRKLYNPIGIQQLPNVEINFKMLPLQWRYNGRDGVSNHQPRDCLLNRLYSGADQRKILKLRVTGLC